jgi:hypothetical protein
VLSDYVSFGNADPDMLTFVKRCGLELFENDTRANYQISNNSEEILSVYQKLIYYLLTYPEIGFKDVRIEKKFEMKDDQDITVDLYIPEIDMIIEIDGPCHYYNRASSSAPFVPLPSFSRRRL